MHNFYNNKTANVQEAKKIGLAAVTKLQDNKFNIVKCFQHEFLYMENMIIL